MTKTIQKITSLLVLTLAGAFNGAWAAEPWPNKPVQIIVPIDAGTAQDGIARRLATALSAQWNQSVVVINQPGSAGAIGTNTVATANPDGHTIGLVAAPFTGGLATRNNLPYTRDKITGVISFGRQEFVIFANKDTPFNDVQQMVAYAKANPNKLDYATPGAGSYVNITMEHLAKLQDLKLVHVPYRNLMQAAPDVVSGRIHLMITNPNTTLEGLVAKGDMKIIGALGKNPRHNGAAIPSLSSIAPEVHSNGYYALIVPSETPKGVVDKIHKDVSGIVSTPEFRQTMTALGAFVEPPSKSGEFDRWIDREIDRLKKIIVQANIKIE